MEKTMKARVQHKHDIEANWLKATNFTPLASEIIVYDIDDTHSYERIKIGDGVQNVNGLPFADDTLRAELAAQITEVDEKVSEVSALVGDTPVAEQINNAIVIATDDEIIELLAQEDMLPIVKDSDGSFLADENENILLW